MKLAATVVTVLAAALLLGIIASGQVLLGLLVLGGLIVLMLQHGLGLLALVGAALVGKVGIPTGTEVVLNPATLMVPAIAGLLLISALTRQRVSLATSRVMLPMVVFLVAGLVSLFVGNATWDPFVPRGGNMLLVQLAQWAIFALSFLAFWLTASIGQDIRWLKWMTAGLLVIGGVLAIAFTLPPTSSLASGLGTVTLIRAPFWLLLASVAGGQLFFNKGLSPKRRVFAGVVVVTVVFYSFVLGRESASNWVGVGATVAALAWLRFKRLRWLALVVILLLLLSGLVFPAVWDFAGGDDEWTGSGQSRLVLIERVLSVSMRNPVTGIGPAAYRSYAGTTPLAYQRAFWLQPQINSHNNYVDIFSQFGLVGLALFVWLVVEVGRLGTRLLGVYADGFEAGYVRGVLAAGVGAMSIMIMADWILPFVYNIGFPGFQASVLVWLFLGGLVALEAAGGAKSETPEA
jgi:hypothetical protein